MKKRYCPNCGTEIKPGAKFCPKCGLQFNNIAPQNNGDNQPATPAPQMQRQNMSTMPPKKPNKLKKIIAICAAIVVILGAGTTAYIYATQKNHATPIQTAKKHSSKKASSTKHHKNNMDNKAEKHSDRYSTKDWMLMGYMNYARKNYENSRGVSSTSDLVKAVGSDIKNGDLEVKQNSANDYTFSNKFGDVDVTVNSDGVTVSGDGDSSTPKSELKDDFGDYIDQINAITGDIEGNSDNTTYNTSSKASDKTGDLNTEQLVTAAFVDIYPKANSAQDKINHFKDVLNKDQLKNITKNQWHEYLASEYAKENTDGEQVYAISYNISTSDFNEVHFTNGDQYYIISSADKQLLSDPPKSYKSKKELIKKYAPYKKELNQIANGLRANSKNSEAARAKMEKDMQ